MRCLATAVVMVLSVAGSARAQEPGQFGVVMAYPASLGVIWHVSDRIAIRPEISLTQTSNQSTSVVTIVAPNGAVLSTSTTQSSSDQWQVGFGASGLLYVNRWDALRTYISPRFQYSRGAINSTTTSPFSAAADTTTNFISNQYLVSGSYGAQYALGSRFAVFGELGFLWSHMSTDSTQPGNASTSGHTAGLRSGVGVILYF